MKLIIIFIILSLTACSSHKGFRKIASPNEQQINENEEHSHKIYSSKAYDVLTKQGKRKKHIPDLNSYILIKTNGSDRFNISLCQKNKCELYGLDTQGSVTSDKHKIIFKDFKINDFDPNLDLRLISNAATVGIFAFLIGPVAGLSVSTFLAAGLTSEYVLDKRVSEAIVNNEGNKTLKVPSDQLKKLITEEFIPRFLPKPYYRLANGRCELLTGMGQYIEKAKMSKCKVKRSSKTVKWITNVTLNKEREVVSTAFVADKYSSSRLSLSCTASDTDLVMKVMLPEQLQQRIELNEVKKEDLKIIGSFNKNEVIELFDWKISPKYIELSETSSNSFIFEKMRLRNFINLKIEDRNFSSIEKDSSASLFEASYSLKGSMKAIKMIKENCIGI